MTQAKIIDGKQVAATILEDLTTKIHSFRTHGLALPKLVAILVGDDPASQIYVANKIAACNKVGILSQEHFLPAHTTEHELLKLIDELNHDVTVSAILVQLPLPAHINQHHIIEAINPKKDADGFHPYNLGRLMAKNPLVHPCTPKGIMRLIQHYNIETQGKQAVIIGSSVIVGRPMALELLNANATVTVCNSYTRNLSAITRQADLLISATGQAHLIDQHHVKPGAIVFDIGITRLPDGRITGDVDFAEVVKMASMITPVPGGVGPMTVAMLLENCVQLAGSY